MNHIRLVAISFLLVALVIITAAFVIGCARDHVDESSPSEEPAESVQKDMDLVKDIQILAESGGRVSWRVDGRLIAFDRLGDDGYADIWTMAPDGSNQQCLTCDNNQLPSGHIGNPEWHPSGDYLVLQAADPLLPLSVGQELDKFVTNPGQGYHNNIWLMTAEADAFWQLTSMRSQTGVLHPHFSHLGDKLLWSQIAVAGYGEQVMKLADFNIIDGKPQLSNIRSLNPGNLYWYETHGFSPDDSRIIFSAYPPDGYLYDLEIYTYDLATGRLDQLTNNDEWDEHAHFSPDGSKIIWSSSEDVTQIKATNNQELLQNPTKLELWLMNADGTDKQRLTHINDPGAPEYIDSTIGAGLGDGSWSPNANAYVAKLRIGRGGESVVMIEFEQGTTHVDTCLNEPSTDTDASDFASKIGWEGYGLYESVSFDCSEILGFECDGSSAKWEVIGCGEIDKSFGEKIIWNSGHGACEGRILLDYQGTITEIPVKATMPTSLPVHYWSHVYAPDVPDDKLREICDYSEEQMNNFWEMQRTEADELSDKLEEYIKGWLAGKNSAEIPKGLLPIGIDNEKTSNWRLYKPDEITAEQQWYYYPAREEPSENNWSKLMKNNAATHVTYLNLHYLAPYGSQLIIEGDFPHARFMSYQISPPFDPEFPYYGNKGQMEVPLVDVDIRPDAGSINPFVTGEDRNAENRQYHVYFDLEKGNMVDLNPVLEDEHFRAEGNTRVGGAFESSGPLGNGVITIPVVWLRYYVPDEGTGPLAGVPLPKAIMKLETGEEFWLQPDLEIIKQRQLKEIEGVMINQARMVPAIIGPNYGWEKIFDIYLIWAEGKARLQSKPYGPYPEKARKQILREEYECQTGKGPNTGPPGSIAHSATDCPYNNYIRRSFQFTPDHVYVLTGKMPTTPKTSAGEPTMESAQARYWSICHTGGGPDGMYNGVVYGCIYDEEITVDSDNNYIIVYGQGAPPSNAKPECGVTWQEIGPEAMQGLVLRWQSVYPDHYMEEYAPNDNNIPWETGAWSQESYDITLIGNNEPGVMGPYHPVIHYLTKQEFEQLGCLVDATKIPDWE